MNIPEESIGSVNTILYCASFEETLAFYRDILGLPITFSTGWFVEFSLGDRTRLSIADETRASIKSCSGKGITISLEVEDIEGVHKKLEISGCDPTEIKKHPWSARFFFIHDPEGHRLEFWTRISG
ncbi:MAG: VOC family protein [Deltaproteobacteria bacterium]|nr:VOC family protein [Deltaproteobacteria bacterium]